MNKEIRTEAITNVQKTRIVEASDANEEKVSDDEAEASVIKNKDEKRPTLVKIMKKHFPWKDLVFGLAVPKMIFHYFVGRRQLGLAIGLGLGWCAVYVLGGYVKNRKIDWLAMLAAFLITIRMLSILFQNHPTLQLFATSIDNLAFGIIYMVSIIAGKPFFQLLADGMDIKEIPERIRRTSYYSKAWQTVTLAWGAVNLVQAGILLYFKIHNPGAIPLIDGIFGWPTTIALMVFSFWYPKHYWMKMGGKIEEYNRAHP